MNKVILIGRLTADPEYKQTQAGIPFCRFRIAVNRPVKKDAEQQTDFVQISCWRGTAEFVARYFSKGEKIVVEGSLRNNDYTDANGVKHYGMEVLAQNVEFGESKRSCADAQQQQYSNVYAEAGTPQPQQSSGYNALHDMPRKNQAQRQAAAAPEGDPLNIGDLGEFEEILSDGEVPF